MNIYLYKLKIPPAIPIIHTLTRTLTIERTVMHAVLQSASGHNGTAVAPSGRGGEVPNISHAPCASLPRPLTQIIAYCLNICRVCKALPSLSPSVFDEGESWQHLAEPRLRQDAAPPLELSLNPFICSVFFLSLFPSFPLSFLLLHLICFFL